MSKRPKMTDRDYERARADRIIAARFKTSCMNDTKWVRLLDALTSPEALVADCRAKLVWDTEIRYMHIDGMQRDFDYWPHAMEAMISGTPRGWYDYKEIEWIEFPAAGQDVVQIRAVIESVGQFELESTDAGLRLYAYR
jgi:hypothetical protein